MNILKNELNLEYLIKSVIIIVSILSLILIFLIVKKIVNIFIKRNFCKKYVNKNYKLPRNIKVKKCLKKSILNFYYLDFPSWEYSKKDGTRDLRKSKNHIKWGKSYIYLDKYFIYSNRFDKILELVKILRINNINIDLCKEEENKKNSIIENKKKLIESNNIQNLILNYSKTPREFEVLCSNMYEILGYNSKLTPATNDGGYDIELIKNGERTIVECKCYNINKKVGRPDIQKLVGANQIVKADYMVFITTSDFSPQAKDYANEIGVELINGKKLIKLLGKNFPNNLEVTIEEIQLSLEDVCKYVPKDIFEQYFKF